MERIVSIYLISTSKRHMEHPFDGQNTQQQSSKSLCVWFYGCYSKKKGKHPFSKYPMSILSNFPFVK